MGKRGTFSLTTWFSRVVDQIAQTAPARMVLILFAVTITFSGLLLSLPISAAKGEATPFVDAIFTAASAICVTGLSTLDTVTHWSSFGQVVIWISIAIGGLGVMTLASMLGLAVSKHLGLSQRLVAATERGSELGELGALLKAAFFTSVICESAISLVLFSRFMWLDLPVKSSLWHALFMGVSIFNNAGFCNMPGGLTTYVGDWFVSGSVIVGTIMGGIGFPVILDVTRNGLHFKKWTLHSKLTVSTYFAILLVGTFCFMSFEWYNPATLGHMNFSDKFLASLTQATSTRTTGLSTLDVGNWNGITWFFTDAMMFIGGGSAGTAGGVKVTTFAVLLMAIVAEARGDRDIALFRRRIPEETVRLAVSVALLGAVVVGVATLLVLEMTGLRLDVVLFEVVSAFATCGFSTGITPFLPTAAKYVLIALMYLGRTGTMTLAVALAMRERKKLVRMPVDRPIVG